MTDLQHIQKAVGQWAEQTFPLATDESILAHLRDELAELRAAESIAEIGDEAADVFLILLHLCERHGVDLATEAARKFHLCRQRVWAADPERGYVRHVDPDRTPGEDSTGAEEMARRVTEAGAAAARGPWLDAEGNLREGGGAEDLQPRTEGGGVYGLLDPDPCLTDAEAQARWEGDEARAERLIRVLEGGSR